MQITLEFMVESDLKEKLYLLGRLNLLIIVTMLVHLHHNQENCKCNLMGAQITTIKIPMLVTTRIIQIDMRMTVKLDLANI